MARAQSKLTVMTRPWHANFTETNHLGAAFMAEPHKFDKVLTRVFTASRVADNPLTAMTKGMGRTSEIESFDWEWELMGSSSRPLIAIEDMETGTTPGKYGAEFRIKLDEDWFKPGDVLTPGDKKYLCRVQREAVADGDGFVYYVQLMGDDQAAFLDPDYTKVGVQWSKLFSVYEEGGDQSGSTTYAMPMKLRSNLSTYRKEYSVTGDAANQALVTALMDANGKVYKDYKWLKYAEAEYWIQWYKEKEKLQYVGDDMTVSMFRVDPEQFSNTSYGIFISDSARDQELFMILRQLTQAALQNQMTELSDVIKMFSTNSTAELRTMLETSEDKRREREQQMQQMQSESQEKIAQSNLQAEKEKLAMEKYKVDANNQTKIDVAEINSFRNQMDQDVNDNGIPDQLEIAKLKSQVHFNDKKINLENRKLDIKEKEIEKGADEKEKDRKSNEKEKAKDRKANKNKAKQSKK